ncbi:MAG: polysaccharide deacetylase family protein, partial [Patescibacteria group bacterium]
MNFLAVNYHYIDEEDRYPRGIYPVSPARFRLQLQELGKFFKFVGQREILEALEGKKRLPENSCAITFDDGLRSQYEEALPILDEMGIPAIFFINGLPYLERRVLFVHKVHWCRAHLAPDEFLNEIRRHLNLDSFDEASPVEIKKLYPYDNQEEAQI